MEVNITDEDVERLVKDTLIKTGLGKAIADSVRRALSGYDSPVDRAIKAYVAFVAGELVRERFTEQIRVAVAAAIDARVTTELVNTTVNTAIERMVRAAEDQ